MAPPTAGPAAASHVNERALLFTLAGIQFTHIVDFMVMMPLGPQFTRLFGISDAQFGLLVSAYTLAAGVSGLAASLFVDRFERKTLLLSLYLAFAVATLACGLAPDYGLLMAARIAAGLFGGLIGALVHTMVGDAIPFERRGRAMGVVMASFSLATVAGVPASLWLAEPSAGTRASSPSPWRAWRSARWACARCRGWTATCRAGARRRHGGRWWPCCRERNHWRAFGFSALVMATGFTMIPYLTIYMTANVGLEPAQVPLVYFAGGVATFFTSRLIGVLADRWGKARTFRVRRRAALLPLVGLTNLGPTPLWALIIVTTLFFVLVSGRFVPGMALITAAATPALRGTFMSLNGSVQSAAMGVASIVGGLLIGRDANGLVEGYERCGWVAVALTLVALWWVGRLRLATAPAR